MKKLNLSRFKALLPLATYLVFYLIVFCILDFSDNRDINYFSSAIDKYIPFNEYFIIPYLLWFPYMFYFVLKLYFKDRDSYYEASAMLQIGMTIFLIISVIYPNGLRIRPNLFIENNIFVSLCKLVYTIDSPTNVFPSIHVYNSLVMILVYKDSNSSKKEIKFVKFMGILIILSTLFVKQHSIYDVIGAFVMAYVLLPFARSRYRKSAFSTKA